MLSQECFPRSAFEELGKHFDLSIVTLDEVVEGVSRRWSSGSVRPGA